MFLAASEGHSADQNWQVGLTPTYYSGTYGTGTETDMTYVPLTVKRLFHDGDVTLVIPYVSITGDGNVTLVGGVPFRTGNIAQSRAGAAPSGTPGAPPGPPFGPPTGGSGSSTRTTHSGLGDIILRARYYLVDENGLLPTIAVIGRVKVPTADADKGLGTGEFDKGFGLELSKRFTENWIGFLDGGYTFIGDPPGLELNNQWYYDLGVGYYFTKKVLGSLYYEEWRALVPGLADARDLLMTLNYTASDEIRFNSALLIGLSSGAPAYGLTGGISLRF